MSEQAYDEEIRVYFDPPPLRGEKEYDGDTASESEEEGSDIEIDQGDTHEEIVRNEDNESPKEGPYESFGSSIAGNNGSIASAHHGVEQYNEQEDIEITDLPSYEDYLEEEQC